MRLGERLAPEVDTEGHLLSRCAAAGVRVPVGAVLLDGAASPGAPGLGPLRPDEQVLLRALGGSFAVRASTDDRAGLTAALHDVRQAAPPGRCDVLVLRSVQSVHAGRVHLRADRPYDVVESVEGEPYEPAGVEVRTLHLPRLRRRQRAHRGADPWRTPLPPWGMRLSRLLRDVRRALDPALDPEGRQITWADDGRVCRLVGAAARMQR